MATHVILAPHQEDTMTDHAPSDPLAIRHLCLPRLRLPKLSFGAAIAAVPTGITQANSMAYVDPFKIREQQQMTFSDIDLEGRDPGW